ncbi:radical SAM protein [bacterium]|nr:radical SAM protein [bacterium]
MILDKNKPVFGTLEWAPHNENFINGCAHDCRYCYSKEMAIRFKRKTSESWPEEVVNQRKLNSVVKKYKGRVMFPSSHDITPDHLEDALFYLRKLLSAGNDVLLVTKPHFELVESISSDLNSYKTQLLFRFTIGSADSDILKFWEPHAPDFDERFNSLIHACDMGFNTSVSIEPMLDKIDNIISLANRLLPYVTDAVWIGKPNFLLRRLCTNAEDSQEVLNRAKEFDSWYSDSEIHRLFMEFKDHPQIKWKDSIKKVLGLSMPHRSGLDI